MSRPPVQLEFRPARSSDRPLLRRINHAAYRDVISAQFGAWDETDQDLRFDDKWSTGYQLVLVDGEPVGAVSVRDEPERLFVAELVIDPAQQNRGIGSAVLRDVIARASLRHVPVELAALHANRARALYERLGFLVYARTDIHFLMRFGSPVDDSGSVEGSLADDRAALRSPRG